MDPAWLILIVPLSAASGFYGAYYFNTYRGQGPWD